ncbi:MAG TPA: hypothetical protein VN656_11095 [Stellaceae bacterium]|jgi:hypothetical protein|nr:hypothetical protein [Stellaceae bacterium]
MPDRPEDIHYLRGLAARLRSLAMTEPNIADRLRQIADEADDRADAMASRLRPRGPSD